MSFNDEIAKGRKLGEEMLQTGADFLRVELDTAMTFAQAALGAGNDTVKRDRNRVNARKGYDTLLRLGLKFPFVPDETKFRELKDALELLGEKL